MVLRPQTRIHTPPQIGTATVGSGSSRASTRAGPAADMRPYRSDRALGSVLLHATLAAIRAGKRTCILPRRVRTAPRASARDGAGAPAGMSGHQEMGDGTTQRLA